MVILKNFPILKQRLLTVTLMGEQLVTVNVESGKDKIDFSHSIILRKRQKFDP